MQEQSVARSSERQKRKAYSYNPLAQPFLKWAGGKRQLIPIIKKYIPRKYTQYYEPFVGAGAVLFSLQPAKKSIVINDTNSELINCYKTIRDNPEDLLNLCKQHESNNSKEYYYRLRGRDRQPGFEKLSSVERAARIIYLNKTCFNGLFRVNSQGQFNVPYGDYANPVVADPAVIKAVSTFLNQRSVTIDRGDFEDSVSKAKKGAFVYFDPPYHPISDTSSFTGYSINGFGEIEQKRLKSVCDELSDRGCHVLVSNSNAPFIRELYGDSRYEIVEVRASRSINSVGSKRGKIGELLIYNKYECKAF
ncbi:DNA adenine methylase [Baaleninema simplex]|uniref:DNA adenine methylase n=1 Tax=Baaleninema simplex TaxID=2862350 RepID=UPI000347863F|nr:DNA adenine methylase [Baaleninema simplex]